MTWSLSGGAEYGRKSGTTFGTVGLAKYAEAFGATGLMLQSPNQIFSAPK
jgi:acetolactate synthase I/II/III large subunit